MNSNERHDEFVYLLRTREFIRLEENVFKIGRTANLTRRFGQYPKSSELIRFKMVKDSFYVEKKIKEFFKQKFRKMEYGLEWFEGDRNLITLAFEEIACKYEHEEAPTKVKAPRECGVTCQTIIPSMQICECGFSCASKFGLTRHKQSKSHELNMICGEHPIADENGIYVCDLCHYSTERKSSYRNHISSERHKSAKQKQSESATARAVQMSSQNEIIQPVTLTEVMKMFMKQSEMFIKHQEATQIQNTEMFIKHQETTQIQNTEMFKTLAERIVASSSTSMQNSEMHNANNNKATRPFHRNVGMP